MNILLTSAGRRVSLLRLFQRDLERHGLKGNVFATDLIPECSPACQVAARAFTLPRVTDPGYPEELLGLCQREGIRFVVPTIDTELLVLAQNRVCFAEAGIEVVISTEALVQACRDKRRTHELFGEIQLPSARIYSPDDPVYPCFVKPIDGSCSIGLHLIRNEQEWPPGIRDDSNYMICEYVDPARFHEFTIDLYYRWDGRLLCIVPRRRLEVRAGEVSKGRTTKAAWLTDVRRCFSRLTGVRGCITAQVFVHPDTHELIGIEINPRFGGGYPLTDAAGAHYTDWLIRELMLGEAPGPFDDWEDGLFMLRYDDEVFVHAGDHPA